MHRLVQFGDEKHSAHSEFSDYPRDGGSVIQGLGLGLGLGFGFWFGHFQVGSEGA